MKTIRTIAAAAALMLGSGAGLAQAAAEAPAAPDYAKAEAWLCLPGRTDTCSGALPTTALNPNGYGSVGQAEPARNPAVDCFYVYPTVSRDAGMNSDLQPGREETFTAYVQFARFAGVCKTYAPMYRQATLAALMSALSGGGGRGDAMAMAYADVRAAWRHYLQNHNKGRPFVLVGHSQGTIHLSQLLASEIEGSPAAARMLSAILLGFNVEVPEGKLVGGSFRKTPLCSRVGETGCVITWVSFRATNPPPAVGSPFGRASRPGMTVGCTNPARFAKGSAPLDSYWPTGMSMTGGADPVRWSSAGAPPTFFLRTEGLLSGTCVNRGNAGYLAVTVNADPSDARTDDIPGDVALGGRVQQGWGLHLVDMSVAMGDLLGLVEAQAEAFPKR